MAVETDEIEPPQVDDGGGGQPQQPDNNGGSEPLKNYYGYLKAHKADVPENYDSFKSTLSDSTSAKKYYDYLKQNNFDAPPTYESFSRTLGLGGSKPPVLSPEEQHDQNAQKAREAVSDFVMSADGMKTIDKLTKRQHDYDYTSNFQGQSAKQDASFIPHPPILRLPDEIKAQREQFLNDANDNPDKIRSVVAEAKRLNPKLQKQLDTNMYLADSEGRGNKADIIKQNVAKIKSGDLAYDPVHRTLTEEKDPWSSLKMGLKEHSDLTDDYNFISQSDDGKVIDEMENRRNRYDPDTPVPTARGNISSVTNMMGQNLVPMAKGTAAAVILGSQPELTAAAPWLAATFGSSDLYQTQYASKFNQSYNEERNKGKSPEESLKTAKDNATFSARLAFAQGIAMMGMGSKLGLKAASGGEAVLSDATRHAIKDIATQSGIAGGVKGIENIHEGKPLLEGVPEAIGGNALFMGIMGLTTAGGKYLTKGAVNSIRNDFSALPPENVNAAIGKLVETGAIHPDEATRISKELAAHEAPEPKKDAEGKEIKPQFETFKKNISPVENVDVSGNEQPTIKSAVINVNGKMYEGANHAEALLKAQQDGQDISHVDRKGEGKFMLSDGSIIDRAEAKERFGSDKSEMLIDQDENAKNADKEYAKNNSNPRHDNIQTEKNLRTLDYGDFKGKEENEQSKEQIKQDIIDDKPVGNSGEKFSDFIKRAVPAVSKIIEDKDNNSVVVTHSSVLKAVKVWEEMGRPDMEKLSPEQTKEFADRYVNLKPEKEGEVEVVKGANGTATQLTRHGETEDNKVSDFRDDNTQLTDKGIAQAKKAGGEIKGITDGNVAKIVSSDLPRTVHTSNLIMDEVKGEPHTSSEAKIGKVTPKENAAEPESNGDKRIGGMAQRIREKMNLRPYEKGKGWSKDESLDFGKAAIAHGIDPDKAAIDKNYADLDFHERMAVVQAHTIDLAREMHKAGDTFGQDSNQYKDAQKALKDFEDNSSEIRRQWAMGGQSQQGEFDTDLDSFTSVKNKISQDKPLDAGQIQKVKRLTTENKNLQDKVTDLEGKLKEATDKELGSKEKGKPTRARLSTQLNDIAKRLRTSSEFDSFLKGAGGDVQTMGVDLPKLKEIAASILEDAAKAVKAGENAIDFIRDAVSKLKEDVDKDKLIDALHAIGEKEGLFDIKENLGQQRSKMAKPLTEQEQIEENENNLKALQEKLVDKKGNKFTPEESKAIYDHMKENYLDKGIGWRDAIKDVSNDTGLSFEQVSHAVTTPKTKPISDAMWKNRYDLNKNRLATQRYVNEQGETAAVKNFKKIANSFRELSVFGHGGVFVGTHAGMTLMDLPRAKYTVKAFLNAYKLAYGKSANYEQAMENLRNQDNYVLAQKAGLKNNPDVINNDAEIIAPIFGKFYESGKRGFNAIKILRQNLFDSHYNALSDAEKADPKSAEAIARLVNNATGASNLDIPNWVNDVTFAGGMEAARWGKLTRNPMEATKTALTALFSPEKASTEDRVFAKVWAKRVGTELATFAGLLTVNAALQHTLNKGQNPVNLTDPTKSDWLKMKIGNTTFDFSSGMMSTLHFMQQIGYQAAFDEKKGRSNEVETTGKTALKYGIGKLSPFYGDVAEAALRHDYNGNTLPWSSAKPLNKFNHKLSWEEYASSKLPLPVAEGFKSFYESAQENGMSKDKIDNILDGLKYGIISGTTGFKAYEDHQQTDKKEKPKPHS